jgi:hypothetical protein
MCVFWLFLQARHTRYRKLSLVKGALSEEQCCCFVLFSYEIKVPYYSSAGSGLQALGCTG